MVNESDDDRLVAELVPHAALLTVLNLTGNVTSAARELGIPQPTASRRLAALGERLGAPVIEPAGRGVRLTRAGTLLAEAAERAVTALRQGVRQAREEIEPERGHVAIGFLHLLGRSLVPSLLRDFLAERPHARFSLVQGSRQTIVDQLTDGELDLALVAPPPDDPGLDAAILSEQELFVSAPSGHWIAGRAEVTMTELANEVFVMLEHGYGLRQITDEACAKAGFQPVVAFEGQESDTVRGLVAAGLGVAILPSFQPHPPAGVVEVPLHPRMTRSVGLVWPSGGRLTPAVTAFRDFVLAATPARAPQP
ncbi:LysR family transcriptional regulator [Prauserella marina]|uniref:DNA-binding transcriptional regulator, LysR family n=1 Tax=Prauserella marina TaxID=530584 RepID=A0A222VK75_9PSEU|nr:LysR family transcriptional regulator [Prauserella marina]ASR34305.1 LysR family transcriptional regulator [Prauserella marina]PWV71915.1 DNA-binding transcriptional LysR family regulator [Prauserella marina]SDD90760.1 DNA-binding transcriptional regulator, LysR family [Prauserella marina]